jgi:hypothetical protein
VEPRYLDEELALIDRLQDELYETGLIKESGEKIEYEGNETLGTKPRTIYPYDYDFISYDFLKVMLPQPELFELRQVLAIPKEDTEARHEYIISVIKERVDNADIYEREYFSKYPQYGYSSTCLCGSRTRLSYSIQAKNTIPATDITNIIRCFIM